MNDECSDLKREADLAGDAHYRAMTNYMTDGRTRRLAARAYGFAVAYRSALKWLIDCYSRVRDRVNARRKLDTAMEMKHLVDRDIETLEQSN
jgi:hypothetical protein